MTQKVHCGRLIINKDGAVKKVDLANGGGTRDCTLSHIDIGFDEIHDILRELYELDRRNRNSKVYDFRLMELDTNRYRSFFEYVHRNGLKFRSTLLYLCTPADNENIGHHVSPEKNRTTIPNPVPVVRRIPQVEADSSTSPILIQIDDDSSVDRKSTAESLLNNRIVQNLRISSTIPFSNYSFEKSLNELIDYLRNLIIQYNHESIFIQLFEYICTLHGLSSITLDQLKQHVYPINEQEKQFYHNALEKIEKLARSMKATIELNRMKISHIDRHTIIADSFTQFHRNFNIVRDQWINPVVISRQSTSIPSTSHPNDSASSRSFSSTNHPIEPQRSTTFSSTNHSIEPRRSTTFVSTNSSIEPRRSTNFSSTNVPSHPAPSTSYSSRNHSADAAPSSSRYHSHSNSQKQPRRLSPSPHRSHRSSMEVDNNNNNEKYSLFRDIFKSLDHLSDVLYNLRYKLFHNLVKIISNEIRSCRSYVKLSDHASLEEARQLIISVEKRLTDRLNDEYHRASPHSIPRHLEYSFEKTLDAIKQLLNAFQHNQSQITQHKRPRKTRWSPPDPPLAIEKEDTENKPILISDHDQTRMDDDESDDQSSEASHSSFGDEVLMEVARDAYEQRPNRYQ